MSIRLYVVICVNDEELRRHDNFLDRENLRVLTQFWLRSNLSTLQLRGRHKNRNVACFECRMSMIIRSLNVKVSKTINLFDEKRKKT